MEHKPKLIFLIGFMGCGKSTISKLLAKKIKCQYLDLDQYIKKEQNCSIIDLFKFQGEAYFRQVESEALTHIVNLNKPFVIALGGGTPCFNNNLSTILNAGLVFYLKTPAQILLNRTQNNQSRRPLLKNKTIDELKIYLDKMLNEREVFYNKAHYIINTENLNREEITQCILTKHLNTL